MEQIEFRGKGVIKRYAKNPIITYKDIPYPANSVFNAGVTTFNNKVLLLLRVEDRRGISHLTVATSDNGYDQWKIDTSPTFVQSPETHPEEIWGIEDPRITMIKEFNQWYITYTSYYSAGAMVSLASTNNFKTFERIGPIMPPDNKDAALFPIRFKQGWALIHRPAPASSRTGAHIWISFSPDLKHWGAHKMLIHSRSGPWWDADKIGLSTPPLQTEKGWLILYHGVKRTASGRIYRLGLALLDLEDPTRCISRSSDWIFSPEKLYEKEGDVDNVVFPCGWIEKEGTIWIYYGAADTSIAVAETRVNDLLEWLKNHNS